MFDRIARDPAILGGKPIIRGTRISVAMVLEWLASGADRDGIARRYPFLEPEDIDQAVGYATAAVDGDIEVTVSVEPAAGQ